MPGATSRLALPYPSTGDAALGPAAFQALAEGLDDAVLYDEGNTAGRPTSTPGSPGIAGRLYFDTSTGILYQDTGTAWRGIPITGAGQIGTTDLASNAVTTAKIADANVTAAKLADDVVGEYQMIHHAEVRVPGGTIVSSFFANSDGSKGPSGAGGTVTTAIRTFAFNPSDHLIAGRTSKLRLRIGVTPNDVALGASVVVGARLVSVDPSGSGGALVVGEDASFGSAGTISNPAAGQPTWQAGSDFNCPSGDNQLAVVFTIAGATTAANSAAIVTAEVQLHHV